MAATAIAKPKVEPEEAEVAIFLQYERLLLGDLTDILNHLSRAYDLLNSPRITIETAPYSTVLASLPEPLRIERVETGSSITALCMGATPVVMALALAARKAVEARKIHWEGEKAKWEAKEAEYRVKSTPEVSSNAQRKAIKQVRELVDSVEEASKITLFRLVLGNFLTIEHVKAATTDSDS